nr:MAG TPA: hypothetical protein [Caudoviricetes sp.]
MTTALNWYTAAALRSLGERVRSASSPFRLCDLVDWVPEFAGIPGLGGRALEAMQQSGYAIRIKQCKPPTDSVWQLTVDGWVMARAVAQAHPRAQPANPHALIARLWALLRIRRQLTSDEALGVLLDAGAGNPQATQQTIASYLHGWSKTVPHAVALSRRRVAGCKRYVLVADIGRCPPPVTGPALPVLPRLLPMPPRYAALLRRRGEVFVA